MKSKTFTLRLCMIILMTCPIVLNSIQAQIQVEGLISENEGSAGWDADGSGPEPYGNGHSTFLYYAATRDYVDNNCNYGAHVTAIGSDFPVLSQALAAHGYDPGQLKLKMGLASQGDDLQGADWFAFGPENYMNFYPIDLKIYLDDELMITGLANYMIFHIGSSTGGFIICESNYFLPFDASGFSPPAVQEVAAAFMQDVGSGELKLNSNTFGEAQDFTGNGRIGSYYNFNCTISKGHPELPFQGLAVNHEGFAGWDADGTGPEPKRNGHDTQLYYIASRDYDDIDPDPNACFARLLGENGSGFQNFALQLEYRGFNAEQVKIKMDVCNLGEDIEGEDWSFIGGIHEVSFYHSLISCELNGEPLFGFVCDTVKTWQDVNHPGLGWWGTSAVTSIYNASENSSEAIQAVAASFFKDIEDRQIQTVTTLLTYANQTFSGNGRLDGGFWQINEAGMVAVPARGTQIQPGNLSGHWTMAGHPYIVSGDVTIPDGQTLVIDPGVWVKFSDRITFKVEGAIQAVGDTSNTGSIIFTAVNPELGWGHFVFDSTAITNEASVFRHCIFEYGFAPEAVPWSEPTNCGGAIAIRAYDNVMIENCVFHHNRALFNGEYTAGGGAIALWTSSPEIRNCVFSSNRANYSGGIVCYNASSPAITNCLFYGNISLKNTIDGGGAILVSTYSDPILLNNTFVNNHSNFRGGALEIYYESDPDLINNIFWGNTAPLNSQVYISSGNCNANFRYNDIEGGQAGIGPFGIGSGVYENNLETDPAFMDALALNYQLGEGSPCIDAGIPDVTGLNLPMTDLLGNVRIWDGGVNGTIVDMGPYEFGSVLYVTGIEKIDPGKNTPELLSYPNPFTVTTAVEFILTESCFAEVTIYNLLGQAVTTLVNETLNAGTYQKTWQAGRLPDGIYLVRMKAGNKLLSCKVVKVE
ncbi:protein containing Por secretion system C-terminal sorting domain [Lentimicrobium saccharophilum]|uniref:Protein containing Por secretion system C-terminal sorting domain n=1 Tax=Lentimicrobium saccharophilum TaxID=1678841 RepID=A0A0S7BZY7_9BACT|nr:right-handed parallel beta-helix repeat-containing protein [Lentimicrobium saccharophilum]GAP42980.1 protein containing Por secretion system C-terminal sorting domain [Lentimicrobium saccharophilum]